MSTSKHFNRICAVVMVLCLAVTLMLCFPDAVGIQAASKTLGYESRLFDTSYVHSIDIVMDDWDSFIENCESEEYSSCAVVIDGESYKNIAIRAKGNTSLSQVANYGNDRYSFKIEFDHYNDATTYHGLDKLCLNNIIQDNTYMKDYLCYTMMNYAGVSSPLCSFAYITVNGEDWGLYLAVEAVEDSFLERNYNGTGNLYKPDSMSMGGGRGNGKDFDQDDFDFSKFDKFNTENSAENNTSDNTETSAENAQGQFGFQPPQMGDFGGKKDDKGGFGGMGSDDVKLIYTDDDPDSYENIFDSAKTDITDSDKTRLINSLKVLNSDDAASTVDVDSVIKYFAVHNFVCNFDSYTGSMIHNYYLYENDGILSMIPWDYNLAFGAFVGGSDSTSMINFPIDSPVSGGDTDSRPMLAWIFADEKYTELYHEALSEFIANYFESGYFGEEIDRVTALISPYVEKDPTKFCTYDEFTEGVAALKEFCTLRAESVRGQLDGTIPSTSDAQSADSSALISGSSVSISAMGSMNVGGGMGGGKQDGGFGTPPDGNFGNFDGQMPSFDGNPPELPSGDAPNGDAPQPPTNGDTSGDTSSDNETKQQTNDSSADTEKIETAAAEQNEQTSAPSDGTNAPEPPSGEASQPAQEEASSDNKSDDNSENPDTSAAENDTIGTDKSSDRSENSFTPSPKQNSDRSAADENNGQDRPQMPSDSSSSASSNTETIVLLCISAGALIAAILLTKIFKDRI